MKTPKHENLSSEPKTHAKHQAPSLCTCYPAMAGGRGKRMDDLHMYVTHTYKGGRE